MENKTSKNFEEFLNNAKNQAENYTMPTPSQTEIPRFTALSLADQMSNQSWRLRADSVRHCEVKNLRWLFVRPSQRTFSNSIDSTSSNLQITELSPYSRLDVPKKSTLGADTEKVLSQLEKASQLSKQKHITYLEVPLSLDLRSTVTLLGIPSLLNGFTATWRRFEH